MTRLKVASTGHGFFVEWPCPYFYRPIPEPALALAVLIYIKLDNGSIVAVPITAFKRGGRKDGNARSVEPRAYVRSRA